MRSLAGHEEPKRLRQIYYLSGPFGLLMSPRGTSYPKRRTLLMSQKRSARARWSVFGRRTASSGLGGEPGEETRHICRLTEVGKRGFRLVRGDSPEFCGRCAAGRARRSIDAPSMQQSPWAAAAWGSGAFGAGRRLRRRRRRRGAQRDTRSPETPRQIFCLSLMSPWASPRPAAVPSAGRRRPWGHEEPGTPGA